MISSIIHPQLPLGLEPSELLNFDTFVEGDNALVTEMIKQCAVGSGERQLYLWSESGFGKSHLLQSACHHAAKLERTVCYLTAENMLALSEKQAHEMFQGLENLDLICLDDLSQWVGISYWQPLMFDLINRLRENETSLLVASTQSPDLSQIELADLRSRLSWGPVFQLKELDDADKVVAMKIRLKRSGLNLTDNVADYLLSRFPRDLSGLFEKLGMLDKAAMSAQKPITIPLIKKVFPDS